MCIRGTPQQLESLTHVGLMLGQRCRQWASNNPTLGQHVVFPVILQPAKYYVKYDQCTVEFKQVTVKYYMHIRYRWEGEMGSSQRKSTYQAKAFMRRLHAVTIWNCKIKSSKIKLNEWGFRLPLCTCSLNWARRTSWGWWDEWDDTVLQTQDSKFKTWQCGAKHTTSRSRRLSTILNLYEWAGKKKSVFLKLECQSWGSNPRSPTFQGGTFNHCSIKMSSEAYSVMSSKTVLNANSMKTI